MTSTEQSGEGAPGESDPVLITRYPNRRLYDRSQARYVTLQEIAEMVRRGRSVSVRDSKSGEDLTRTILTQIILEYHPERMELIPIHVLNALIRTNESVLGFLREYLRQSLSYLELFQQHEALNPLLQPMHWLRMFLPNPVLPAFLPPSPAESNTLALTSRIAELERRLDELQRKSRKPAEKPGREKR